MSGIELFTETSGDDPALLVDVEGYEGPLDLLLDLARRQKVDLSRISVLALAEQYLRFIEAARSLRLELAADYLVMAAWLAFLKSRLLLPEPPKGEAEPAADLAAQLAFRLRRLEAMRRASGALAARPQLGRDVFSRGMPEGIRAIKTQAWDATLYDLLSAYAEQRQKVALARVRFVKRRVWTLAEARGVLEAMVGEARDWSDLDRYLLDYLVEPSTRATVRASTFTASLELAKEGKIELKQESAYAPLFVRTRKPVP